MPLALRPAFTARLHPRPPFNFEATVHKPSWFPAPVEDYQPLSPAGGPARFWQTLLWEGQPLGVRLMEAGSADDPAIDLTVFGQSPLAGETSAALVNEVRWRFDLDADLTEFGRLCGTDPLLASALERRCG